MKIAIYDDCPADRNRLKELILESAEHSDEVCFYEFPDGKTLLKQNERYDIIFLDIMIGEDREGIKTATYIRQKDENALLVFYTAYDYPASCIVGIQPFQYLVKDKKTEKLKSGLQKVLKEAERRNRVPSILALVDGKQYVLKPEDILFISILDKGTAIYLTEEKASELGGLEHMSKERKEFFLRSTTKLNEHYAKLEACGFAYGKKSYIINIHHITATTRDTVQLKDGTILNIARSKKKEFESRCSRYWRG